MRSSVNIALIGLTFSALLGAASSVSCNTGDSSGGDGNNATSTDPNAPVLPPDGTKNNDESDVDCGGSRSAKCADGKQCKGPESCASGICTNGTCVAARPDDGIKNGDESDVDCGGSSTKAQRCLIGKTCTIGGDCVSDACSYKNVCVKRRSCTQHFGGDTCGAGEPDDPTPQHEDCCRSVDLPMPGKILAMDKFHVTAGRFRIFLDAVKGDVRSFIQQHRPLGWDPTWDTFVPTGWDIDPSIDTSTDADFLKRAHSSVWHQLGNTALLYKLGRDGQPFEYGCDIAGNGSHTYRMPDNVQVDVLKDVPHKYSQEILDAKALNCVTALMLMAFCEWDWPGSRLPTYLETRFAWDAGQPATHKFPWGNTPAPGGYDKDGNLVVPAGSEGTAGDPTYANWKFNYSYPTNPPATNLYPDFSAHIAAPGRFPKGNGPFGHADIAGNMFDLTSTIAGTAGQHPDDRELTWGRNGSWEGHTVPFASYQTPWTAPIMRKYGKAGGRCVRD